MFPPSRFLWLSPWSLLQIHEACKDERQRAHRVAEVLRLYSILTREESLAVSLGSLLKAVEQISTQARKSGDARTKRVRKNTGVGGDASGSTQLRCLPYSDREDVKGDKEAQRPSIAGHTPV